MCFGFLLFLLYNLTAIYNITPNLVPYFQFLEHAKLDFISSPLCYSPRTVSSVSPLLSSVFYSNVTLIRYFPWPTYIKIAVYFPTFPVILLCFISIALITTWYILIDLFHLSPLTWKFKSEGRDWVYFVQWYLPRGREVSGSKWIFVG